VKQLTVTGGASPPTVTALSPNHGSTAGGTVVTITGTNLTGATELKWGATAVSCAGTVATCKVESATEIKATTPATACTPGAKIHVTVTTPGGTSSTGAADEYTCDSLPTYQLTVTAAGTGTGTVTSAPAGIECGATCSALFAEGVTVVLKATAASGSTFAGWGGECSGTGECVVGMTAARAVTASFSASSSGGGGGGSSGGGTPGGGSGGKAKTQAEIDKEKRAKALKQCHKLQGNAKAKCIKRANQIGKPKQPTKKSKRASASRSASPDPFPTLAALARNAF
jgi:hypothetical protein